MDKKKKHIIIALVLGIIVLYFVNYWAGKTSAETAHNATVYFCERSIKNQLVFKEDIEKSIEKLQEGTAKNDKIKLQKMKWALSMSDVMGKDINFMCNKENNCYKQKINSLNYFDMEEIMATGVGSLQALKVVLILDTLSSYYIAKAGDANDQQEALFPEEFDVNIAYASKIDLEKINYSGLCKSLNKEPPIDLKKALNDPMFTIQYMRVKPAIYDKCAIILKEYAYYLKDRMESEDPYIKALCALKLMALERINNDAESALKIPS